MKKTTLATWLFFLCAFHGLPLLNGSSATAATRVLLLVDEDTPGTDALESALSSAGNDVTRRPPPEYTWNGTNPPLDDFDCVVHLNGETFADGLPVSAQQRLEDFVSSGQGGFIGSQWNGFEFEQGRQQEMRNLILQRWLQGNDDNCGECTITYTAVPGQENHPVLEGVPSPFTFFADGHDASVLRNYLSQPPTALMTAPSGGPAVIVREFGEGRVVNFSCAPNYLFQNRTLRDQDIRRLYVNAVAWACEGLALAVDPNEGMISLGLEGGPFDPLSQAYTLTNRKTDESFDYEVAKTQDWISLDGGLGPGEGPLTGTLAPEESATATVIIDEDADALAIGDYSDTISFTNLTSGEGDTTRIIHLRVLDPAALQMVFNGDFELGDFTGWTQQNSGPGQFEINDGTLDPPGPDGPLPPCEGAFNAISTQSGDSTAELIHEVGLLATYDIVTLSWIDRIRNHAGAFQNPDQQFRVQIRNVDDQVLREVFSTNPGDPLFSECTARSFDVSEFAEQTIRIAFVVQSDLGLFNVHVDDVKLVLERSNQPPEADAGADQTVECTSSAGADVTLDGSSSSDPDSTPGTNDDIVQFEWFENFGQASETLLGEGEVLGVALSLGSHAITLRVTDSFGEIDTDEVVADIVDTTAPTISASLDPTTLWPPNHRMMWIDATVSSSDACSTPSVVLTSVTSDEPDNGTGIGDGNTTNDIQDTEIGTADFEFRLRAERAGAFDGRVYTAVYEATDGSGNRAEDEDHVFVPHDRHGVTEPIIADVSEKYTGTTLEWGDVEGALYYNVVRGDLSTITELGNSIDLGLVICIEAESLDTNTVGWEDTEDPAPGQTFFYIVEYFDGWNSSYGTASADKPRWPASGGCE